MYINAEEERNGRVKARERNHKQMFQPKYLNKSSSPLKSQSRISNNIYGCVPSFLYLPFSIYLSPFLSASVSFSLLLSFSLVCLACFACISEHVRFRDFNWPEGIPPCGLTLRGNFRDILSRAGAEGNTLHTLFFRLPGKSARLSQHRATARF